MKKIIGISLFLVCILVILVTGCTNSGTSPAPVASPTPQIVYVTVLVTSTPTQTAPMRTYQGDVESALSSQSTPTPSRMSSKPLQYSGSGDDTRVFSVTDGGGFIITGSYAGPSNFIVHITDGSGNIEEIVFNKIGSYSGRKIIQLDAGKHYLEVQSSGNWIIEISPS